jgi:hypothetical protein
MTEEINSTTISFNETDIPNYTSPIIPTIEHVDSASSESNFALLCIKGFIFGSIIIGALLGNALVILAVRKNRKLR